MTLVPILVLAALTAWLIYRDYSQLTGARRFVRIDYSSQRKRRGLPRH